MLSRIGQSLVALGVVSLILPLLGMQLRIVNLFGGGAAAGIAFIAIGLVLWGIGFVASRAGVGAQQQATPPQSPGYPQPGHPHFSQPGARASAPPPIPLSSSAAGTTNPPNPPPVMSDNFHISCVNCGNLELRGLRFCGRCGAQLPGAAVPPVQLQSSQRSSLFPVLAVLVIGLLVVGGLGYGGYKLWNRNPAKTNSTPSANRGGQVGLPVPLGNGSTTPPVTRDQGGVANPGSTTIGPHDATRDRNQPQIPGNPGDQGSTLTRGDHGSTVTRGDQGSTVTRGDQGSTVTRGDQSAELAEQRAIELVENGDFAAAIREYDRAIASIPNNPLLYQGRASAKTWTGDLAGAIADYRALEQLQPRNLNARLNRLQLMIATGSHQAALPEAAQTAAANPGNCDALVALGQAQNLCGQVAESQQTFARAAQLDPNAAQKIYDSGFAHLQAGLNQIALIEFIAVAWMDGRYAGAYYGIGRCRAAMGHTQAAIEAYERYLQFDQRTEFAQHARDEIARLRVGR